MKRAAAVEILKMKIIATKIKEKCCHRTKKQLNNNNTKIQLDSQILQRKINLNAFKK